METNKFERGELLFLHGVGDKLNKIDKDKLIDQITELSVITIQKKKQQRKEWILYLT